VSTLSWVDVLIMVIYVVGVTAWGSWLGRGQKDAKDYFLAEKNIPWWAVSFSIIATETSVLTFISVPATAYTSDLWMLQLATGYLLGRITVAALLLPAYFRGDITTAYALLEKRFGPLARRFASLTFIVTRVFASSVRLFATAIPIKLITGLPYTWAILLTGLVTLVYTYYGGLRAVVWVDVLQLFLYLTGALVGLIFLIRLVPGGWGGIVDFNDAAGKLRILHLEGGVASGQFLLTGLIGGAFLSMASHGADHLIVQRLLAAKSLPDARKALIGSGVVVILQFGLFLIIGLALYAYYQGQVFQTPDEIFPRFILEGLPPGVSGLVIAGVLAVAMSSDSSVISLASAMTHDLYAPLSGRGSDAAHMMKVGKALTLLAGLLLVAGGILFQFIRPGTPIVVLALQIASFTYGGLLGGFLLGVISRRAGQRDAILGMAVAITAMALLWGAQQFGFVTKVIDPLWFSLLGSAITVSVGMLSAKLAGAPEQV
jgi:solute:Na+ symporter, SSS family